MTDMHLSMHNWMRSEPIEVTVARLARFGYGSIEIKGEPDQYDTKDVRALLAVLRAEVLGRRHADPRRAQPVRQGREAARRVGRLHEERRHDGQGARRHGDHDRAQHGRQDRAGRHAGGGVGVVRREPEGDPRARQQGRRRDGDRAAQPLRDALRQPRRTGAGAGRCGRRPTSACASTAST